VPGQIEHAQAAEAESDRGHRGPLDGGQCAEDLDDAEEPVPQGIPIPQHRVHRLRACIHAVAGHVAADFAAEDVGRHGAVADLGEAATELDLSVASPLHAVEHQHGRRLRVIARHHHRVAVQAVELVVERQGRQRSHDANVPRPCADGMLVRSALIGGQYFIVPRSTAICDPEIVADPSPASQTTTSETSSGVMNSFSPFLPSWLTGWNGIGEKLWM
jgi:hypothetical protein